MSADECKRNQGNIWTQRRKAAKEEPYRIMVEFVSFVYFFAPSRLCVEIFGVFYLHLSAADYVSY
jgi:hypothetical protein